MDRDLFRQLQHLLRPLASRIANTVARGVVQLVNDGKKQQLLQIDGFEGGPADDAEHFHPYGFSSVPLAGAEVVVAFPNGDLGHPLVVATSDRRHRPTGGQAGEVCMYTDEGDVIRLGRGHVVSVETSGQVRLGSATASQAVVIESALVDFMAALLAAIGTLPTDPGKAALTALYNQLNLLHSSTGWKAGTTKTKAE